MKRVQQGFTLIELMIVVAIIGILAAIAIPAYLDYTIRAKVSEALVVTGGMKVAIEEFRNSEGDWPADEAEAGIDTATSSKYTSDVSYAADCGIAATVNGINFTAGGPCITATINNVDTVVDGESVVIEPSFANNTINWACGPLANTFLARYRPSSCRDW